MITNQDTNTLFISDKLETKYPKFHDQFIKTLADNKIDYNIIKNTKDVWCRDYMPIQVSDNKFVQFLYHPDYLEGFEDLKTDARTITTDFGYEITESKLNIDGGNVVRSKNKVILTDKIFKENVKTEPEKIIHQLRDYFEVEEIILIPHLPYDEFGHADGMVRFYNEDTVLISDYSTTQIRSWHEKFLNVFEKHNLEVIPVPYYQTNEKNEDGIYNSSGCYINFLEIGDFILLPAFGGLHDSEMIDSIRHLYPDHRIYSLNSQDIAKDGGVLNCITWNIKHDVQLVDYLKNQLGEIEDYGNAVNDTLDKLDQMEQDLFDAAMNIASKGVWKEWLNRLEEGDEIFVDYKWFGESRDPHIRKLYELIRNIILTKRGMFNSIK